MKMDNPKKVQLFLELRHAKEIALQNMSDNQFAICQVDARQLSVLLMRHDQYVERIEELQTKLDTVWEITNEMGEDTRLGSAAIGRGVTVVGSYLERLETALGDEV
jgi:hypothetical protein